jgi:uncharacterized protein YjeT (DUF2065 family)
MPRYAFCGRATNSLKLSSSMVESLLESFLKILGVVMIIEGIPWFLSPRGAKNTLHHLAKMPDRTLRTIGLALMALGLLAVYAATG